MFGLDRITSDPDVLGGMRAMRISVSLFVNLVANAMTRQETVGEYPLLELEDIQRALRCAAWAAEETAYFPASALA